MGFLKNNFVKQNKLYLINTISGLLLIYKYLTFNIFFDWVSN